MNCVFKTDGTILKVVINGDILGQDAEQLRSKIRDQLGEAINTVNLELNETNTIDSLGLAALLATANSMKQKNGTTHTTASSPDLRNLFQTLNISVHIGLNKET
jgi:anti-anti-sigma factor